MPEVVYYRRFTSSDFCHLTSSATPPAISGCAVTVGGILLGKGLKREFN
jgi:hypothetical protein